jgi:hypothetical protein
VFGLFTGGGVFWGPPFSFQQTRRFWVKISAKKNFLVIKENEKLQWGNVVLDFSLRSAPQSRFCEPVSPARSERWP